LFHDKTKAAAASQPTCMEGKHKAQAAELQAAMSRKKNRRRSIVEQSNKESIEIPAHYCHHRN
jgi:hypothetical protein